MKRAAPTILRRAPRALPPEPRVLFLGAPAQDYLADGVFHGLRLLLGERAVDFPKRDRLYASFPADQRNRIRGHGFTLYGLLDDIPVDREGPLERVRQGEFDLVVFGDIWRGFGSFTQFLPYLLGSRTPYVVLDGADSESLYPYAPHFWRIPHWWLLPRPHRRGLYFKRELTPRTHAMRAFGLVPPALAASAIPLSPNVRPTSFAVPEEKLAPDAPAKDREFATHVVDPEVAAELGRETAYSFDSEEAYYDDLRRSRFAITTKRAGWESLRTYEIAANGCVPCFRDLDRKPASCAPHGLDRTNCLVYRDARDLRAQIGRLSEARYEGLRAGASAWARENTTRRRAHEVLTAVATEIGREPG